MQVSRPVTLSAAERAYRHTRQAILSRELPPYEVFSEASVADAVGVSRTPVREALLRLQAEGFLRLLPKVGAMVIPVTEQERADVLETRHLVESFAVRRVITGGGVSPLVTRLRERIDVMRRAVKDRDTAAYVEADRAFHEQIVAAAGNEILIELYRSLRDKQLRMGVINLVEPAGSRIDPSRLRATLAEHERIADAIAARSLRAAESAVQDHLDRAAHLLASRGSGPS
ncbi:MAG: GntR family transcriptional regulator [Actinobacteria bacterium]|nr:GntR family transcriptional regulator [Actinomycetota bacterium]